jgi:hypothetical protein
VALLAACGEQPAQVDEPDPTATETDSSDLPAAPASVDVSNVEIVTVPPIDVSAQLSYLPPQAGGGEMTGQCLDLAADYENETEPKPDPHVELFEQPVSIGQRLTICYVGFTGQDIGETVFGPNGETMRSATFTAEYYKPTLSATEFDVDVTDYMVLPGDPAGIYTVVVETPQNQEPITKEFEVIDQLVVPNNGAPFVTVLSRGTSQHAPTALQDGLVFLSGFVPQEELTLTFWRACRAREPHPAHGLSAAEFVIGAQAQANEEGRAFLPVPDEIATAMQDAVQYELLVIGSQTSNDYGTTDMSVSGSNVDGVKFSARHGNAIGLGQPINTPRCSPSDQSEQTAPQDQETLDTVITPGRISSSSADSNPELALDGSLDTAWQVAGDGVDASILLEFDQPVTIQGIEMVPGFDTTDPDSGENLFTQYHRVRSVLLEFSDGSTTEAELATFASRFASVEHSL